MEPADRLGRAMAVVLGAAGLVCLVYGGYGVLQGTGALVWFAPRLKAGAPLIAAIALPWMWGGALLWVAGGEAVRDAVKRRVPTRRWFGTLATGTVLSAAPGLVWWGWLPFAWLRGEPLDFMAAGGLLHAQFASAGVVALGYFAWSRRLPPSGERFGATVGRCAIAVVVCFGAVALWMREPQPESTTLHEGRSAVEWATLCHSDMPGEDIQAWSALEAMGAGGEAGWRWLVMEETGLGGRFATVWMSWCFRQKEVVGWYGDLRLDDGLAAPAFYVLQSVRPVKPESVQACRNALRETWWGLPAQGPARSAAAKALSRMGPGARPAFFDLFDYVFESVESGDNDWWTVETGALLGHLGEIGIDADHPRREDALRRIAERYLDRDDVQFNAARVVVELDAGGPFGGPALSWLCEKACTEGAAQALAADELETLGVLARPVVPQLSAALIKHIHWLHPRWQFRSSATGAFDSRAVWSVLTSVATSDALKPVVMAAFRNGSQGPQLVAAEALSDGLVDDQDLFDELWGLMKSGEPEVRAAGAWAIAVQQPVEGLDLAAVILAANWSQMERMLPRLTKEQRDRVTSLLERGIASDNADVARVSAKFYPEFHERSQELDVDETGAEK